MNAAAARPTPWHLWMVAILTLLWNGSGAVTIVMAQMGRSLDMDAHEIAYYAQQPFWFVTTTDVALLSPVAAAVALLRRSRFAAWLFALSLSAIVVTNLHDVAAKTSLALADPEWRTVTIVVVIVATLQVAYASTMTRRGVLR